MSNKKPVQGTGFSRVSRDLESEQAFEEVSYAAEEASRLLRSRGRPVVASAVAAILPVARIAEGAAAVVRRRRRARSLRASSVGSETLRDAVMDDRRNHVGARYSALYDYAIADSDARERARRIVLHDDGCAGIDSIGRRGHHRGHRGA